MALIYGDSNAPKEAAAAYRRALELTESKPERRYLSQRLAEVS
jgi:predicted RNA polymerase sigma factor